MSPVLIWRLFGRQAGVECSITRFAGHCELRVVHAGKPLACERWPDVHVALKRAWRIRRELMSLGWTDPMTSAVPVGSRGARTP